MSKFSEACENAMTPFRAVSRKGAEIEAVKNRWASGKKPVPERPLMGADRKSGAPVQNKTGK